MNDNIPSNVMPSFLASTMRTYSKNALLFTGRPFSSLIQIPTKALLLLLYHHP
jgi:hypothetical protein